MPRVTVIIPTYDRPQMLSRAVDSARSAGTDVEIIVVDDASSDTTAEVCRGLPGIKHVRLERNQGVAGARNIGIFASAAPYVAFLDDDDLRLPGSLDLQADALDEYPEAGFVCGAMVMADQNYQATGEIIRARHCGGDVFWDLLELDFPVMPLCTLMRKECFLSVGLLNQQVNSIDDWDIFTRIAEIYPVIVMEDTVGVYRQPTPFSGQGSSARAVQLRLAVRHQLELLRLPRAAEASASQRRASRRRTIKRISENLVWSAVARHLRRGHWRPALVNLRVAFELDPLIGFRPNGYKTAAKKLIGTFGR